MGKSTSIHAFLRCLTSAGATLSLLLVISASAQAAKLKELRTIEGISEYSLDNGLQVLLFPDESKDTTTVNITYRVGSKHENYGETGMAHLLEHLMFKSSKKHPNISKALADRGAKTNGTTWLERTNYYETFKASEDNLDWALSMEADRMVNADIAKKDLDSEMTVVRSEFERGENSPSRVLLQHVYSSAFTWHNYGNATIGARSDIENVKIDNLRAFYRKYYQPDNATLIVAGKFDKKKTLKKIRKHFGKIKKPKRTLPDLYTQEPTQEGERSVTLRRAGGEQVLSAAYHIPSGTDEEFAAIDILSLILGDSPSGRLHKTLIEKQLATRALAWPNQQQDASLMYFNVTADIKTNLAETEEALLSTIEAIAQKPITQLEVDRAKRKLLKNKELAFNSSRDISIELSEWIGIGDWRMLFIHRDRIEEVSLQDVQNVAQKYLIPSNRTLGKFIPTADPKRAIITPPADISSVVDNYKGRKKIAQGEVFDASLENVAAREIRVEKDGIKIASLPLKTRGESVVLSVRLGYGDEASLNGKSNIADLTAKMLLKGTERLNREQLQDAFDTIKASGKVSSESQAVIFHYETTKENLSALIKLIHEIVRTASFPKQEFTLLKARTLSGLASDNTDPQQRAITKFFANINHYPKGHLHAVATLDEDIKDIEAISLDDLKEFHRTHFGASHLYFGIAGDFDPEIIHQDIFTTFSGWQSAQAFVRVNTEYVKENATTHSIETPDKKNSFFVAGRNLDIQHDHPDAPAIYVITRMLGGGFLNSRLAERIRQKDGLSYGVGALTRIHRQDEKGLFLAYAISAPQNTEKVHKAFNEEMQRAFDNGFSQEELKAAIEGLVDEAKVKRSDNQNLAVSLRDLFYDNFNFSQEAAIRDKIQNLSVEDVNRVMKKYLAPTNMTTVKAGDFANAKN